MKLDALDIARAGQKKRATGLNMRKMLLYKVCIKTYRFGDDAGSVITILQRAIGNESWE
jgi:hypothetical protein